MTKTKPAPTKQTGSNYTIPAQLLGVSNPKTSKGEKLGYLTGILYLAPANNSGVINTCKFASKGCKEACLYTAGRGKMPSVYKSRINKTLYFADTPKDFVDHLKIDVRRLISKAKNTGETLCIRLNGTSDLRFEDLKGNNGKTIFDEFPQVQFYDYTKDVIKCRKYAAKQLPSNYHLTFSRSESNKKHVDEMISLGVNVAAVFLGKLPDTWQGVEVINGDESDLRFLDKQGVIVGLVAKGDGKKDDSGFCIQTCGA